MIAIPLWRSSRWSVGLLTQMSRVRSQLLTRICGAIKAEWSRYLRCRTSGKNCQHSPVASNFSFESTVHRKHATFILMWRLIHSIITEMTTTVLSHNSYRCMLQRIAIAICSSHCTRLLVRCREETSWKSSRQSQTRITGQQGIFSRLPLFHWDSNYN
jgi:hypothetical protein